VASIRSIFTTVPPMREAIDVDALVRDVMAVLRREIDAHGIALRTELRASRIPILANRGQIHQVVLNLAANAIDAMAESDAATKTLRVVTGPGEGGGVVVSVLDTGAGVRPEIADRIFDPFFTTRTEGSGMGLAICRSLVQSHGGRLWHSQATPTGAAFHVHLPGMGHGDDVGIRTGPAAAGASQGAVLSPD
jgi:signal transduction histidine kinase